MKDFVEGICYEADGIESCYDGVGDGEGLLTWVRDGVVPAIFGDEKCASILSDCSPSCACTQLEGVESSIRSSHLTANDIIYADNGEKLALWERNYMMSHNKLIGGVFLMQERGTRNDERSCTGRFSLFCALSCWHSHPPSCSCARLVLTSSIRPQTLPATARTRMLRTSDQSTNPSWMRVSRCG
jgi:hypothetical protein